MLEVERRALALFDFWVATSDFTKRLLVERGFPADRVLAVRPGLALGFAQPSERDDLPRLSAIVVGNLIPRKGAWEFLSALAARVKPDDCFALSFVGRADADLEYAVRCRAVLVSSAELAERVTFRGPVPHAEMPRIYASASLVVSASKMETFGIALQEARAHGAPILALDCGNAAEHVVVGMNGILAVSFDELAAQFLELSREPAKLSALSAGARSTGDGESWDAVAARFAGELERLAT
jgi:glycosyltransferase involved in cell wall biosynthesis